MTGNLKAIPTRFRAYQLDQAGASFSYFADGTFTLIEAMATETSRKSIQDELRLCGRTTIDTLHITSWDADHCSPTGLAWILENCHPSRIEYPGYEPHCDRAENCQQSIRDYQSQQAKRSRRIRLQRVDPPFVRGLNPAEGLGYNDIIYHPRELRTCANDNSTVKLFRHGMFNVLSLGDIEDANIGALLRSYRILCRETDVMILAHHGADNGVTTKKFLEHIDPSAAICCSNHSNQYDHPDPAVRSLLHERKIPLYTTKNGDVIIHSIAPHKRDYEVINLQAKSMEVSSRRTFPAKKAAHLSGNADAIHNRYHPGFKGIRS